MTPKDLEQRPIADLTPYARNSRTHSEAQVAQIAASITEFGFTNPVLVDAEGGIIAGHGRVLAAQSLGLKTVPVLVLDHLSEDQRRAYVIADNKLALNAGWDDEALRAEIEALADDGYDLDLIGFDAGAIQNLLLPREEGENDAEAEWQGMPEFEDQDPCFRRLVVSFDRAEDVDTFFQLIGQQSTEKTKSIRFPARELRDLEGQRWSDGE
jgi:hypothetical protein